MRCRCTGWLSFSSSVVSAFYNTTSRRLCLQRFAMPDNGLKLEMTLESVLKRRACDVELRTRVVKETPDRLNIHHGRNSTTVVYRQMS